MPGRNDEFSPAERPPRRCRCGHYPTSHMVVVPVDRGVGGFRLEASGPCVVCGEGACPRFAPGT